MPRKRTTSLTTKDASRDVARFQRARKALEEARTAPEVKAVRDDIAGALRWAKQRCDLSYETASDGEELLLVSERRLGEMLAGMELDRGGGDVRSEHRSHDVTGVPKLSDLGIGKMESSRCQAAARVPEDAFQEWMAQTRAARKPLISAALVKLGRQQPTRQTGKPPELQTGIVGSLQELIDIGQTFACIYADPPWKYGNQGTRAATGNHYATMTVEEIAAEPVPEVAAENCHLHLWTTNAFLFEAKRVLDAWGFEYKSVLVWVKPQMGIGNYWRVSHEFLLFGLRGKLPFQDRGQTSWVEARRTKHSRKPREVRERVEKVSPGPYLEMYGREPHDDWTMYGNQIEASLFDGD